MTAFESEDEAAVLPPEKLAEGGRGRGEGGGKTRYQWTKHTSHLRDVRVCSVQILKPTVLRVWRANSVHFVLFQLWNSCTYTWTGSHTTEGIRM